MVRISLENIAKKYKNEWIFKNLNLEINSNEPIAIIGSNGSGKSTLMQVMAGIIPQNKGHISYFSSQNQKIEPENIYYQIAFVAPYLELIEEFTLTEAVDFHTEFKPFINGLSKNDFLEEINLKSHKDKSIKNFSSGMKQKLKLALAFKDNSEILFLDEPTANLDLNTQDWYLENVQKILDSKIVIVSSNEPKEYSFCKNHLNILNYKL